MGGHIWDRWKEDQVRSDTSGWYICQKCGAKAYRVFKNGRMRTTKGDNISCEEMLVVNKLKYGK